MYEGLLLYILSTLVIVFFSLCFFWLSIFLCVTWYLKELNGQSVSSMYHSVPHQIVAEYLLCTSQEYKEEENTTSKTEELIDY